MWPMVDGAELGNDFPSIYPMELSLVNAPPSEPAPIDDDDPDDQSRGRAPSGADQAQDRSSQAWEQIQMGFPKLMGAPAYWKPRRTFAPQDRPFDPDELPLEADRPEDEEHANDVVSPEATSHEVEVAGSGDRGRRRHEGDLGRRRLGALPSRFFRWGSD